MTGTEIIELEPRVHKPLPRRTFTEWLSDGTRWMRRHRHRYQPIATYHAGGGLAAMMGGGPQLSTTVVVLTCPWCDGPDQYHFTAGPGRFDLDDITGPDKPALESTARLRAAEVPDAEITGDDDPRAVFGVKLPAGVSPEPLPSVDGEYHTGLAGSHTRFRYDAAQIENAAKLLDPQRRGGIAEGTMIDVGQLAALRVILDTACSVVTGWPQVTDAPWGCPF